MATEAAHILVSGIVQGVGYRAWTEHTAAQLGVKGWVRNLYDDRVEILAEGERAVLDALIAKCRRGPRHAEVSAVDVERVAPSGAQGFEIRRTASEPEKLTSSS